MDQHVRHEAEKHNSSALKQPILSLIIIPNALNPRFKEIRSAHTVLLSPRHVPASFILRQSAEANVSQPVYLAQNLFRKYTPKFIITTSLGSIASVLNALHTRI